MEKVNNIEKDNLLEISNYTGYPISLVGKCLNLGLDITNFTRLQSTESLNSEESNLLKQIQDFESKNLWAKNIQTLDQLYITGEKAQSFQTNLNNLGSTIDQILEIKDKNPTEYYKQEKHAKDLFDKFLLGHEQTKIKIQLDVSSFVKDNNGFTKFSEMGRTVQNSIYLKYQHAIDNPNMQIQVWNQW
jgi:hypothetical protein